MISDLDEPVIELRDVWRRYRLVAPTARQTLRGTLAGGARGIRREWFWALSGVELTVQRGRALGVIGRNGAGKSTLLRLTGGIGRPDRGSVRVRGRVGALLDLGREFHPDLTGRQNAEIAAVVAGLTRAEFARRLDDVVAFAGLAAFMDQPLHAYSDGMRSRLAFSVLAHVDPDVLLVDEVLAVGDAAFQRRCVDRIEELRSAGSTIVFVSHDLSLVRRVCDEAVWLDGGVIRSRGPAAEVVSEYLEATLEGTVPDDEVAAEHRPLRAMLVQDRWEVATAAIRVGDGLSVVLDVVPPPGSGPLQVSVKLRRVGADVTAVETSTPCGNGAQCFRLVLERLDLAPGRYEVQAELYAADWSRRLDAWSEPLDVSGEGPENAVLAPPHEWQHLPTGLR